MLKVLLERGIQSVDIVGLALDYCVKATAEDAIRLGFNVRIIEDGCRAVTQSAVGDLKKYLYSLGVNMVMSCEVFVGC